jgi:DNA-binding GntR family transcriptional regulator
MSMKRAIKRVPDLRAQIFDQLRQSVNAGEIGPEERLTEMTVAKRYAVSRTPAREALALLHQAGILTQDSRGYCLPNFSRQDIEDLFKVRWQIEPFAVRSICESATDAELQALEKFANAEFGRDTDDEKYIEINRRVRNRIFQLLRNKVLQQIVTMFEDRLAFIRIWTLRNPEIHRISAEGNKRLVAAIVDRDADKAETAMRYLLKEAQKAIFSSL